MDFQGWGQLSMSSVLTCSKKDLIWLLPKIKVVPLLDIASATQSLTNLYSADFCSAGSHNVCSAQFCSSLTFLYLNWRVPNTQSPKVPSNFYSADFCSTGSHSCCFAHFCFTLTFLHLNWGGSPPPKV